MEPAGAGLEVAGEEQDLELRVRLADDHVRRLAQPVPEDQRFPGLDDGYEAADEDNDDAAASDEEGSVAREGRRRADAPKEAATRGESGAPAPEDRTERLLFLPNGSLFPAGRVRPELLRMTPLLAPEKRHVKAPGRLGALSKLVSAPSRDGAQEPGHQDADDTSVPPLPPPGQHDQQQHEQAQTEEPKVTPQQSHQEQARPQPPATSEVVADSWEDVDLDAGLDVVAPVAASDTAASDQAFQNSGANDAVDEDDCPVILVDVTPWTQDAKTVETARHEVFEELLKAEDQLDQLCEAMFEVGAFYHSTERCVEADVARLEALNAGKRYAPVNYPEVVHVADLFETRTTQDLWREISRRAAQGDRADAARLLKGRVRDCSRSLVWKRSMMEEIDVIAEREELARMERDEITERIETLTTMASELEELWATTDDLGEITASCSMQLEAVRKHLADARQEEADFAAREKAQQGADKELSVVDMILAMVLQRSVLCLPDMKQVDRVRKALSRKWELQFGRLPYISHTKDAEARQETLHKQAREDALWDRAQNLNDDLDADPRQPSPEGDIDALVAWIEGNEPESELALARRQANRSGKSARQQRRRPRSPSPASKYKSAPLDEPREVAAEDRGGAAKEASSEPSADTEAEAEDEGPLPLAVRFDEDRAGEDEDEEDPVAALVRRLPETKDDGGPLVVLDASSAFWHLMALVDPFFHVIVHKPRPLPRGPSEKILDAAFAYVAPDTEETPEPLAKTLLDADALAAREDEDIEEASNEFLAQFAIRVRPAEAGDKLGDLEHADVVVAPNCPTAAMACSLAHRAIEDGKLFAISVDTFHADYDAEDTWARSIWPDIVDSYPMDTPSGLTHNFPHL